MELTNEQTVLYKWYAKAFLKRSQLYGNHEQLHFFDNGFFLSNNKGKLSASQTFHVVLTEKLQKEFPVAVLALNQKDESKETFIIFAEEESVHFSCMFVKEGNKFKYSEGLLSDDLTIRRAASPLIQTQLDRMVEIIKNVLGDQKENRMYAVTGMLKFEHY